MSAFTGIYLGHLLPPLSSAGAGDLLPGSSAGPVSPVKVGSFSRVLAGLGYTPAVRAGVMNEMLGGVIFEKIIVSPRTKALGFVLSTTTINVDVWSTFRRATQRLSSINVAGGGGTLVTGGPSLPATFGPWRAYSWSALVVQDGPATISDVVTWSFVGGISGATLSITGTRITVFSVEIDWSDGFDEDIDWLTDVLTGYSGKEQRVTLRSLPRYSAKFNVIATLPEESAFLDALLYSWGARVYGVPWWMDAVQLQANASAGSSVLSVPNISQRYAFEVGGIVVVWRDWFTWEALTVQALSSSTVTLSAPLVGSWLTGDLVIPVKRGRMAEAVDLQAPNSVLREFRVSFACEVV